MDHVAVGENQAVGSEHKTGAAALPLARFAGTAPRRLRNIDLDYRRAELFRSAHDRLRVGIEQGGIVQSAANAGGLDSRFGIICNREGNCFWVHVC